METKIVTVDGEEIEIITSYNPNEEDLFLPPEDFDKTIDLSNLEDTQEIEVQGNE